MLLAFHKMKPFGAFLKINYFLELLLFLLKVFYFSVSQMSKNKSHHVVKL